MGQLNDLTLKDLEEALRISRERQARRVANLAQQLEDMKVLMSRSMRLQSEMRDTVNESRDLRKAPRLEQAPMPPCGDTGTFKVTKLARAMFIYNDMACFNGASRADIIEAFMTRLNMTKAGASSYYQQCKDSSVRDEAPLPGALASKLIGSLLETVR